MNKKLLIIYTAVGKGHKSMAENIASALDSDYEIDMLDLFKFQGGGLINYGTKFYLWVLDVMPWFWNFLYTNPIFLNLTLPLRTVVAGFNSKKLLGVIKSKNYDVVITNQVNPSAIVSYLKGKGLYTGKFVIAFSDFHLHNYWLFKNADIFLVNIAEQKEEMVSMGFNPQKIYLVGMALQQSKVLDKEVLREKYALKHNQKAILVMGGTMGYKLDTDLIKKFADLNIKVFVVCGNNREAKEKIDLEFKNNINVQTFGYIDFLDELYSITDVVVSKPGGMTTAECLYYSLPMAIYSYLPGQEKINVNYLRSKKLVLPETNELVKQVIQELETGEFKKQLLNNPERRIIVQDGSTVKKALADL